MAALVYDLGAALIGALMRRWRSDLSRRTILGYVMVVTAYFGAPLARPRVALALFAPLLAESLALAPAWISETNSRWLNAGRR